MKNYILTLSLAAMFITFAPVLTIARPMIEIVDMMDIDTQGITISVNQNTLRIAGAAGQVMQIYNVTGVCVTTIKIDGDDKLYDLNLQKGCYIVKIGKVVRKISIK